MIKANELRIGNELINGTVVSLSKDDVIVNDGYQNWKQSRLTDGFEPYPLTEEWLVKFGFVKRPNSSMVQFWSIDTFNLYHEFYNGDYIELSNYYLEKGSCKQLEYVHQLQNLYFALTGEELTING